MRVQTNQQRLRTLQDMLVKLLAKALEQPESNIAINEDLDDQGMDSLLYMEILLDIEAQLEVSLSPVELSAYRRIDQLAAYLQDRLFGPASSTESVDETSATMPTVPTVPTTSTVPTTAAPVAAPARSNDVVVLHAPRERREGSAEPIEHTFVSRGRKLAFLEWGAGQDQTVVLIHGILDQALAWQLVAQPLADRGYRVIAPDLRGHGLSDHDPRGEGYSLLSFCSDLADLVDHLQLSRFLVAGHSMGSLTGVLFSACFPSYVSGLMLIETLMIGSAETTDMRALFAQDIDYMRNSHNHRPIPSFEMAVKLLTQSSPGLSIELAQQLCQRVTRREGEQLIWRWDPILRTRVGLRFPGRRTQYLDMLRHIEIPVRLLFGRQSNFNRTEEPQQLTAALPNAQAEYVDGGHNLQFDNPQAIVQTLDSLQASIDRHPYTRERPAVDAAS
jgi:pimeloyl-ACP methyl ester carboxylesterase/acyl carrier protein